MVCGLKRYKEFQEGDLVYLKIQ